MTPLPHRLVARAGPPKRERATGKVHRLVHVVEALPAPDETCTELCFAERLAFAPGAPMLVLDRAILAAHSFED